MSPLVSILVPCFNAERWIAQAIESALAQTWPEKEVIVVDDGSTDRSLDIIKRFDGRIRWETGPNRGSNATRNRLLALARGEWLQYLDADDYLLPEKLARQVEFAREHPNVAVIYSPVAWKRVENGTVVCTETPIPEPRDPWILLALWHFPQTGGVLWRKAAIESVGGWRVGQPCCQEHELCCRLLEADAHFEYCAACLAVYRDLEHSGRITRKPRDEFVRQRLVILDRVERHLEQRSLLTPLRRQAVNDARHELARSLWRTDRQQAVDTHRRILDSDRCYLPTVAPSSPRIYSIAYRVLGFRGAQIAASYKRALTPW
jgi:glycosyltransferase involved in cell wall biosynthesis